jgi:SAM-dependent methyltransferase
MSEPYDPDNLLDRWSRRSTLELHYQHLQNREAAILHRRLGRSSGRVLSVGAGWHPGRHLFPAPAFHLTAVDADPAKVEGLRDAGRADVAMHGFAGDLGLSEASFDVVLYRLVLHHIVFQSALRPSFAEAARLLAPGGALVAIEPGLWHPVGVGVAIANRIGAGELMHGTPDDVPLSPRRLLDEARTAGLQGELHAVTYTWRRMAPAAQRALWPLDRLGSRPRLSPFGHTLMLIARRPGDSG